LAHDSNRPRNGPNRRPTLATPSLASCSTKCVSGRTRGQPCRARASSSCRVPSACPRPLLMWEAPSILSTLAHTPSATPSPRPRLTQRERRRVRHGRRSKLAPAAMLAAPRLLSPNQVVQCLRRVVLLISRALSRGGRPPECHHHWPPPSPSTCARGQAATGPLPAIQGDQRVRDDLLVLPHPSIGADEAPTGRNRKLRRDPLFSSRPGTSRINSTRSRGFYALSLTHMNSVCGLLRDSWKVQGPR
jgi:hypothetical protein